MISFSSGITGEGEGNTDVTKIVTLVFSFSLLQPFEIVTILQDGWVSENKFVQIILLY